MTADYLMMSYGRFDISVCDSMENGVITLYNSSNRLVRADYDIDLSESEIDEVIRTGSSYSLSAEITKLIQKEAQRFVRNLLETLKENGVNLKSGKTVFLGGGSILLKKYLMQCGDLVYSAIFLDNINASVEGYEIMYLSDKG